MVRILHINDDPLLGIKIASKIMAPSFSFQVLDLVDCLQGIVTSSSPSISLTAGILCEHLAHSDSMQP